MPQFKKTAILPFIGLILGVIKPLFGIDFGSDAAGEITDWLYNGYVGLSLLYGVIENHRKEKPLI